MGNSHNDGLIEAYITATEKLIFSNAALFKKNDALRYRLFADAENDLWIYTEGFPQGVFCYNSTNNELKHFHHDAPGSRLNNNLVTGIQQDNNGMIWVATDHGGINLVDKRTGAVAYLENNPENINQASARTASMLFIAITQV